MSADVKPLYKVSELAALLGWSYQRTRRLILKAEINVQRVGGDMLIPVSELQRACPEVWSSLSLVNRRADDELKRVQCPKCKHSFFE